MWKELSTPLMSSHNGYRKTRIEGQVDEADISVLNPAVAPLKPSSPKLALNIALALFLGSVLGLGLSLFAEMLKRSVRSERGR